MVFNEEADMVGGPGLVASRPEHGPLIQVDTVHEAITWLSVLLVSKDKITLALGNSLTF